MDDMKRRRRKTFKKAANGRRIRRREDECTQSGRKTGLRVGCQTEIAAIST